MADILTRPEPPAQPPRRAPWSCSGCDRRWSSLTQAHCMGCHQHFASVGVSDHHDRGGPCRPAGDVRKKNGTPVYRSVDTVEGQVWRSFAQAPADAWTKKASA